MDHPSNTAAMVSLCVTMTPLVAPTLKFTFYQMEQIKSSLKKIQFAIDDKANKVGDFIKNKIARKPEQEKALPVITEPASEQAIPAENGIEEVKEAAQDVIEVVKETVTVENVSKETVVQEAKTIVEESEAAKVLPKEVKVVLETIESSVPDLKASAEQVKVIETETVQVPLKEAQ